MAVSFKQGRLIAEVNVTPFVDVMLVLLIIFMVTAPMLTQITQGLEVDLPQTRTVEVLPIASNSVVLTVGNDGSMVLDEYPVTLEALQLQVKQNVVDKKKQLFICADRDVAYGIVVHVLGLLKEVGIERLGVVAEPEDHVDAASPVAASDSVSTVFRVGQGQLEKKVLPHRP